MAESKSKKPAAEKKIVDIKQGGDAASGTSRQIILNNRPIMQDPMMAEVSELANAQVGMKSADEPEPEAETPGAPAVTTRKKVIPVSHDDDKADEPAPEKAEEPKKASKTTKVVIKPLDDKPEPAKTAEKAEDKKPAPTTEEPAAEKPAEPAGEADEAEPETETKTDEPSGPTETKTEAEPAAEPPAAEEPTEQETEEVKGGGFAGERAGASAAGQPGRSFDETDAPAAPTDDSGPEDKSEAKDKKPQLQPGELTPEQQKAYESGKYFLPIITTETRRMRLEIILAVLFIIIVLAVWLDIMLDAGLLHISGVKPLTHFFDS